MVTTITRTFDATPTDKEYFSLTDNMNSSNLGNIQVPQGSSRISRVDCAFDTDAGACVGFQSVPVAFGIGGVNNIDLQIAIQFASGGSASASSGSVTLYFE